MNKILMTETEINDIIEFEDRCGVNTLLQEIFSYNGKRVNVFKILDDKGCMLDYEVEENK